MGYNKSVIAYSVKSILLIATSFLSHWYGGGAKLFILTFGSALRAIDERLVIQDALRRAFLFDSKAGIVDNIRMFFGRISVIAGIGILYAFSAIIFLTLYALWAAIPPYLVYKIINPR